MVIKDFSGSTDNQTIRILDEIKNLACTAKQRDNGSTGNGRKKRQSQPPPMDLGGLTPEWLTLEYEFLKEYMGLNESIRHRIGHQFSALIKACTFQGKDCLNERYIQHFLV